MAPSPDQESQRYKLTLAYRGTVYHGWQRQVPAGSEELPTVQQMVRLALMRTLGHAITLVGSSRTDAGVHALGQVAHFDTIRTQVPPERILLALNAKLPDDIAAVAIQPVPPAFDAISNTVAKAYRYVIHNAPLKDPFRGDVAFHVSKALDVEAISLAATHLVGEHDFASFAKPGHGRESTVRAVHSMDVRREGENVWLEVAGGGFLWHQVRIMAGTLIDVGLGRRAPESIPEVLAARDRQSAGPTAPPRGLWLLWVRTTPSLEVPSPS